MKKSRIHAMIFASPHEPAARIGARLRTRCHDFVRTLTLASRSLLLLAAFSSFAASPAIGSPPDETSRLIVKLRDSASDASARGNAAPARSPEFDRLMRRFGVVSAEPAIPARAKGRPAARASHLRDRLRHYLVLRAPRGFDVAAAAEAFRNLPEVESAEPDGPITATGTLAMPTTTLPDDPDFARYQWGFRNTGDQATDPPGLPREAGADIHAADAWAITTGDPSVIVAVLDTGVRTDHAEFAGRIWVNEGEIAENGVDDDANGYVDDVNGFNFYSGTGSPYDDGGHGTACASIIASNANNGTQLAGLDWSCRLMPLKVLSGAGNGSLSGLAQGIAYAADNGAKVLSMSLGGYGFNGLLRDACAYAHDEGVFLVAAMMNDNSPQPAYPAAFDATVTAVGSTDPADDRCTPQVSGYGSNYGPHIDVVAPGVSIPVLAAGVPGGVVQGGGTSFSTPHVAGLASLIFSIRPELTADQVRDAIRYSAADQVGRPTEDTPGFDDFHGWGRIDCGRALALAASAGFPTIAAPAEARGVEGMPLRFEVVASDPDGDPFDSFLADLSRLPETAAFTVSADRTQGLFTWAPTYADAGSYRIRFTAKNPFEATAFTTVEIFDIPDPPVITAPSSVTGDEGGPLEFAVTASDPDGDPLTALTTGPLPAGATFTVEANRSRGVVAWTPGHSQAGAYVIQFAVESLDPSGPLGDPVVERGSGLTRIMIRPGPEQPPVLVAPSHAEGAEGSALAVGIEASDADGDPITALTAEPLPPGATFAPEEGNRSARLAWTPDFQQAGMYEIRLAAESSHRAAGVSDPVVTESSMLLAISIADTPRPPTASPGGPYAGIVGVPIAFDGSASSDPDGAPLVSFVWNFGDGMTGVGATPSHTYLSGGRFSVSLTVSDGALEATAGTSATVNDLFAARAYPAPQDRSIRLLSAKREVCVYVEPIDRAFSIGDLDLASLALVSTGTGDVDRITAIAGKGVASGDGDRNGIADFPACFSKDDLRRLFSRLPAGRQRVPVAIEAPLASGGRARAELTVEVVASGGALSALVTPNPVRAGGVISLRVGGSGGVRVHLFDASGRLVRSLASNGGGAGGYREIPFDGRDASGRPLRSGIYFYRVDSETGSALGRLALLR